jgi:hypothetical protein
MRRSIVPPDVSCRCGVSSEAGGIVAHSAGMFLIYGDRYPIAPTISAPPTGTLEINLVRDTSDSTCSNYAAIGLARL